MAAAKSSSAGRTGGTRKKSTGSQRKGSSRKKTSGKRTQNNTEAGIKAEILLWLVLAVSVVLLASNFGIGGIIGNAVSSFFFGLVGLICYPLPFFLFLGTGFVISNRKNPRAYRKMAGFLLLFLALCMFAQMVTEGAFFSEGPGEFYRISADYKTGGGIVGGVLSSVLARAFGTAGTYAIIFAAVMISLVLITQRSMFDLIRRVSSAFCRFASDRREEHLQNRRERMAQPEEMEESEGKRRRKRTEEKRTAASEAKMDAREKRARRRTDSKEEHPEENTLSPSISPFNDQDMEELPFRPEDAFPIQRGDSPVQDMEEILAEEVSAPAVKEEKPPRSSQEEIRQGIQEVKEEIASKEAQVKKEYQYPPLNLLKKGKKSGGDSDSHLRETAAKLQDTLHNFGVNVSITNVSCGPTVTRYELQPEQGVKVSKIVSLTDDIKLNLAATDIRIEAPIPGKAAVGIEVPNEKNSPVMLRELLASDAFQNCGSKLAFAAGKDIAGQPVIADIAKMPHLLIAGATGSGKSVCINTLIMSILYKASPEDVKLIMIDPKVVELSVYNGIPHLFIPVVTDPKKAAGALNWAVAEMTERYNKFAQYNVRDLKGYNEKVDSIADIEDENKPKKMPQIVIIVDELADLMMVAPGEVEDSICRLAQLARAAGLHLIIATQRPSVNVITGLIKANMPSRIAFSVSSGVDSRTILDMNGAEKLLGKGDMLFYPQGYQKPARLQGAFVSDQEVAAVVDFLSSQHPAAQYDKEIQDKIDAAKDAAQAAAPSASDKDAYFTEAGKFIIEKEKASIGMLQRAFKIGFNRAARIMDQLCDAGVVGEEEGTKPRKILMSMEEFEKYLEEYL